MRIVAFVFPHQLFEFHPVLEKQPEKVIVIENSLFFGDSKYPMKFHEKKLAFHKETIAAFCSSLEEKGLTVTTAEYLDGTCELDNLCRAMASDGYTHVCCVEPCDYLVQKRLATAAANHELELEYLANPGFINTREENAGWRDSKKRWHMADYYKWQRTRLNILMDGDEPMGGQWSFDEENRKKITLKQLPLIPTLSTTQYPTTPEQARRWLEEFLETRFELFGRYEDAIVQGENWLYHSILTPMLNVGLLTPKYVVDSALEYAAKHEIPLNSVEGFVRQVIGWREFMRATYEDIGISMRNGNHWEHNRPMPESFYTATTGIAPVDDCISRVNDTAYCHHIERLMVLGGFMFLCEIDPDDIYKWFMELFIDSYDWVMVPNVYAMSQHADGGSITTKPYFSGSNYVIKMSHYKKGEWSEIWDALFWRWIIKNQKKLAGNHRWSMMCKNAEKMDEEKRRHHLKVAESYLATLK